jgi:sec-independent protein translocase protein TatB
LFDVAFSELLVIAVVALLVIGPERLPKVARTLGALTGRMQRYVAQVKEEVNREVRFQELQQLQQEIQQKANQAQTRVVDEMDQVKDRLMEHPPNFQEDLQNSASSKSLKDRQ